MLANGVFLSALDFLLEIVCFCCCLRFFGYFFSGFEHGLVVFWNCEPVLGGFLEGFLDGSAFCSILIIELIVSSMFRDVFSLLKQT